MSRVKGEHNSLAQLEKKSRFVPHISIFLEKELENATDLLAESWANRHDEIRYKIENIKLGIWGEKAFQSILIKWQIPHVYSDPVFACEAHRLRWDFEIPNLGSIDVKTFPADAEFFVVNVNDLVDCGFYVAIKKIDARLGWLVGWLTSSEVKDLLIARSYPCTPERPYYHERFENMNNPVEIYIGLLQQSTGISKGFASRFIERFYPYLSGLV